MAINTGKVVVGGLAGGVVLAVLDFVVNGVLMRAQNEAALTAVNPALVEGAASGGTIVAFVIFDLLIGILLVWTYAAMRPRFGAGPKTALLAGAQVWLVAMIPSVSMTIMGMWTWAYLTTGAIAWLVMIGLASYVGAMLYKEE